MSKLTWSVIILLGCVLSTSTEADDSDKHLSPEALENLHRFVQVMDLVKTDYIRPVDDKELVEKALAGMLVLLDPHSSYLSPTEFAEVSSNSTGRFGGVDLEIQTIDGFTRVISPIEGGPAARAGVLPGELIARIDGYNVIGERVQEVIGRLRGDPGSTVKITLRDPKSGKDRELSMVREIAKAPSAYVHQIADKVLMLRISKFDTQTLQEVKSQLREHTASPRNLSGLIVDLRNNPGGIFNTCLDVANLFLPGGATIVQMRGRIEKYNRLFLADPQRSDLEWSSQPMVVLVNSGSAACSELLAAALRDNDRAIVVGTQTFGTATVQTVVPLMDGGAVKLTTAEWLTPKGRSIDGYGVAPDVETGDGDPLPTALTRLGVAATSP